MNMTQDDTTTGHLTTWILTLPGFPGTPPEEQLTGAYLDPDTWPGDWKYHEHGNHIGVNAADEDAARRMAAEADCDIWLDPAYARCRRHTPEQAGVLFIVRGGAENE
jgi:hypothetical protein